MADQFINHDGATDPAEIARRQNATTLLLTIQNKISELSEQLEHTDNKAQRALIQVELAWQAGQHRAILKDCERKGWL